MSVLDPSDHVVVVGAGLGGWRLCESLRGDGFTGAITLIGEEPDAPYDRPPLSKQVMSGKWGPERITLATDELLARAAVDARLGVAAVGLDVAGNTVRLQDGSSVSGTHVVVATGSRARRLPFAADARLHVVRRRSDVVGLLADVARLDPGDAVAIIGGGFIGAEVATALSSRGLAPVVLEGAPRPLFGVLGPEVSQWLEGLAGDAGVDLRCDVHVNDVVEAPGGALRVELADGVVEAPVVVVGAGALPNVEWLADSGLTIDNGVVVDENLLASARVGAIGDAARFSWRSVAGVELVRIEHWQIAADHAAHLARYWTSGRAPTALLVPYFWSDQYGQKVQMIGHARPDDAVTRASGDPAARRWVALYHREGLVTGVVALNHPRALVLSRHLLEAPTALEDALARAPWAA